MTGLTVKARENTLVLDITTGMTAWLGLMSLYAALETGVKFSFMEFPWVLPQCCPAVMPNSFRPRSKALSQTVPFPAAGSRSLM